MITKLLTWLAVAATLLAVLLFGEQYVEGRGYDRRAAEDAAAMGQQKSEAAAKLADLTREKLAALAELANLKSELEKNREALQAKNAADLRARRAGPSLRFVTTRASECGGSGGSTESPAHGAAPDAGTTVVQLPEPLNGNLWQLVADAQSLAIDYGVLYSYVHNPRLVCELRH